MHSTQHVSRTQTDADLIYELRARIKDLEGLLGAAWHPPHALDLSKVEGKVLGLIIKKRQNCSQDAIYQLLYGERANAPYMENIRVQVSKVRKKLRPFGIEIGTLYGAGYFITPENLDRLNALYAPGERV